MVVNVNINGYININGYHVHDINGCININMT